MPRVLLPLLFFASIQIGHSDESLFLNQCGVCHTLNADDPPRQGPALHKLIGRTAGAIEGFPYSNGLAASDIVWNAETLDRWLENPQSVVSDSYMIYKQDDAVVRQSVIDYLQSLSQ